LEIFDSYRLAFLVLGGVPMIVASILLRSAIRAKT
jgi:hypothetical protein